MWGWHVCRAERRTAPTRLTRLRMVGAHGGGERFWGTDVTKIVKVFAKFFCTEKSLLHIGDIRTACHVTVHLSVRRKCSPSDQSPSDQQCPLEVSPPSARGSAKSPSSPAPFTPHFKSENPRRRRCGRVGSLLPLSTLTFSQGAACHVCRHPPIIVLWLPPYPKPV